MESVVGGSRNSDEGGGLMWWRKADLNRKLDAELQFHLDQVIRQKQAAGVSESEARRQAVIEFGGREQLKEELRDIQRLPLVESVWLNLRFALRLFRKSPTFSLTIVLTLALGIGTNSAVFSAINAILLRPLPFPNSSQLVELRQSDRTVKAPFIFAAPTRVEDWNRLNTAFQAISGYYTDDVSDTSGTLPEKVTEALVAPRFFQVWGIYPRLGRDFSEAEEHFGGPSAIIISHRYWMHRFNGDPGVIGTRLRLDKWTSTIAGVMPEGFRFQDRDVDIWTPSPPDAPFAQDRRSTWYYLTVGRLKPGVSLSEAQANLTNVQTRLGRQFPATDSKLKVDLQSLKQMTTAGSEKSLWLLYGSVTLLLLIACVNIAALLLARTAEREREISVRYSLGASRGAIIRQLLTECFLLAAMGSAVGLFLASAGSKVLRQYAVGFARRDEISLDWHIVLYTLSAGIAATLLCGLLPAWRASQRNSKPVKFARNPAQWLLVGVQVALAVTLLLGAGLLLRSFQKLGQVAAGFETSHVLTFRISGNWGETGDMKALTERIDRTLEVIRETPGVRAASTGAALPGINSDNRVEVRLTDDPAKMIAANRFVSAGYFETMKIPLLAGETCPKSTVGFKVLVNRSFARTYLAGNPSLGRHLMFIDNSFGTPPAEIKGMVADAREQGMNIEPGPTLYWCGSAPLPTPYFLVQTQGEPMAMAETLRKRIHTFEPARSVYAISPLEVHLSSNVAPSRIRTWLLSSFAFCAIALAATGLYGTLSYFVTMRQRESALRLALGASRERIVAGFFMQGLRVAMVGCAAGLACSMAFTKTLSGLLFGITATDAETWIGVSGLVLVVASVASFVPAMRAVMLEPMQILRQE